MMYADTSPESRLMNRYETSQRRSGGIDTIC